MYDLFISFYSWYLVGHIISVIAWMAGIFYLPRLFVYHSEEVSKNSNTDQLFVKMEDRLLNVIMVPAMISSWFFGVCLSIVPGVVDWAVFWPWIKLFSVLLLTIFHFWLSKQQVLFKKGHNKLSGRTYRIMNEVPTVLLIIIVTMVVGQPL
jgi:putative membrane protein